MTKKLCYIDSWQPLKMIAFSQYIIINKRDEIIKDFEAALVDSCRKEGITVTDVNIRNFRVKIADPIVQANNGSRSSSSGLPNQINPTRQMQNHAIRSTGLKTGSFF